MSKYDPFQDESYETCKCWSCETCDMPERRV